eukprot:8146857-Pyramimonas_sp.AAC.1
MSSGHTPLALHFDKMLKPVFAIVAVVGVGLLRRTVVVQQVPAQQRGGPGLPRASRRASTIQARMHTL